MWLKRIVVFAVIMLMISGTLFGQELINKSNKKQKPQVKVEQNKVEKSEDSSAKKNDKKKSIEVKKKAEKKVEKKVISNQAKTKNQISNKPSQKNLLKHKKSPAFDSKQHVSKQQVFKQQGIEEKKHYNPQIYQEKKYEPQIYQEKKSNISNKKRPYVTKKKIYHGDQGIHTPYVVVEKQHVTYSSPRYYHYYVPPRYIYRGLWIRYYIDLPNGYVFYNGYPYYVHYNYLYRYSVEDTGYFDLVDSWSDETYATFYGESLKESYDRCADLRDRLNSEYGEERYFCAERFDYDSNYKYGWDPDDYPDWYWY